ncbi:unnamed protein product, partial [Rotaria magnacalcarata]
MYSDDLLRGRLKRLTALNLVVIGDMHKYRLRY